MRVLVLECLNRKCDQIEVRRSSVNRVSEEMINDILEVKRREQLRLLQVHNITWVVVQQTEDSFIQLRVLHDERRNAEVEFIVRFEILRFLLLPYVRFSNAFDLTLNGVQRMRVRFH